MPAIDEFGDVRVYEHERWVDLGKWETYEWSGGPYLFIALDLIPMLEWADEYELFIGPYRVEQVQGYRVIDNRVLYRRVPDWKRQITWRVGQTIKKVHDRFIQTLVVWGLAWVPVGEEPSWRHIKAVQRFI